MGLTVGKAPFSDPPAGTLNVDLQGPGTILFFEDSPRRVRAEANGETVAVSDRVKMLHETGRLPVYYFPEEDVRTDLLEDRGDTRTFDHKGTVAYRDLVVGDRRAEKGAWTHQGTPEGAKMLEGWWALRWDAVDHWFEEDEEIRIHPRDPYHRVDTRRSSRHIRVSVDGQPIAETDRAVALFETGLPVRFYLPVEDVDQDVLVRSSTHTECPYKGTASYWSVEVGDEVHEDLVWYYPNPLAEAADIEGLLAFYNARVELEVDGETWSSG